MEHQKHSSLEHIDFLEYWRVIKRRAKLMIVFVGIVTTISIIYGLVATKLYQADAVIMPLSKGGGVGRMSSVVDQFGSMASLAGINMTGSSGTLTQFMVLLQSKSLAEQIIVRHNLIDVLLKKDREGKENKGLDITEDRQTMEKAVTALKGIVKFIDNRKMETITVSAIYEDPKMAAMIANAYVDGLRKFINENSFTVAKRNRLFIEEQLVQNRREFFETGKELTDYYKGGKVSSVEGKIDVPGEMLLDKEYGNFAVEGEGNGIEAELSKLNQQQREVDEKIKNVNMIKDVPQQVYLQYMLLKNGLLARTGALLVQQHELAKIEEARNDLSFQIVDPAKEPTTRFAPRRRAIAMTAFLISSISALFMAFFAEYVNKIRLAHIHNRVN